MSAATRKTLLRLAWRNVLRNWRHSLACLSAIACGFVAVALFDGFLKEIAERRDDGYQHRGMMGDVVLQKRGAAEGLVDDFWAYQLDREDQAFIEGYLAGNAEVVRRVRFLQMEGLATAGTQQAIYIGYGYDVAEGAALRGEKWAWNTLAGKPLHVAGKPGAILSQGIARLLGCESTYAGPDFFLPAGNYVAQERPFHCDAPAVAFTATTETAQVNVLSLPVSGLYDFGYREGDLRYAYIPLPEAQKLFDTDKITIVAVELAQGIEPRGFIRRLEGAAEKAGRQVEGLRWFEHQLAAYEQGGMDMLNVIRNLFMTIVAVVAAMTIANTMAKAVNERVRELGTLRCLGFERGDVSRMIAWEGGILSLLACGVGLVLTILLAFFISALHIRYRAGFLSVPIELRIFLAPTAWVATGIILTGLATGTAWLAARRALRLGIAEALRHVA